MTTLNQIQVEVVFDYFQYRYFVTEVTDNGFKAKRFCDGVTRDFSEEDLVKVSLVREIEVYNYVAMDRCGVPSIFPAKPKRNRYGDWEYTQTIDGAEVDFGIIISISFMKKLIGRIITNADEPVEIK